MCIFFKSNWAWFVCNECGWSKFFTYWSCVHANESSIVVVQIPTSCAVKCSLEEVTCCPAGTGGWSLRWRHGLYYELSVARRAPKEIFAVLIFAAPFTHTEARRYRYMASGNFRFRESRPIRTTRKFPAIQYTSEITGSICWHWCHFHQSTLTFEMATKKITISAHTFLSLPKYFQILKSLNTTAISPQSNQC